MRIKYIKTLWGSGPEQVSSDLLRRIKAVGFDGVEAAIPDMAPARWGDLLAEAGLDYVGMVFASTAREFTAAARKAAAFSPLLINAHDGRDKMTFGEGRAYFREVLAVEQDLPTPVAHETHRHRLFYTPWSTADYLREFPTLRICADFSHWCCVCESMLRDVEEMVMLACERAIHIHGRVGWEEGPQVADPRAPEYHDRLERHEEWWDRIVELRRRDGVDLLTFDPEFGPPGYMPAHPYTRMPIVDLWEVHEWMVRRERERWSQ